MFSKIKVAVVGVLLAAMTLGGGAVALAQGTTPPPATAAATGTQWAAGHISAIAADNFTIQGPQGGSHVIFVNGQTLYFGRDAQAVQFSALQVGERVLAAAKPGSDGNATAVLVIDFGQQTDYKGVGVVSAVNSGERSFTFVNLRGKVWDFYTDSNTKFTDRQGNSLAFSDVQVGSRLFVHAEKRSGGKWWALDVKIGKTVKPAATSSPQS
jgi:hypothetical protein